MGYFGVDFDVFESEGFKPFKPLVKYELSQPKNFGFT
jgi:hypothetical protein